MRRTGSTFATVNTNMVWDASTRQSHVAYASTQQINSVRSAPMERISEARQRLAHLDVPGGFCVVYMAGLSCNMNPCKYKHLCSSCFQRHPLVSCPSGTGTAAPYRHRQPSASQGGYKPQYQSYGSGSYGSGSYGSGSYGSGSYGNRSNQQSHSGSSGYRHPAPYQHQKGPNRFQKQNTSVPRLNPQGKRD